MNFPRKRIRFTLTHDGSISKEGFIILDLKGLDIDGVTTLALDMQDLEHAREQGDSQAFARDNVSRLLGGEE